MMPAKRKLSQTHPRLFEAEFVAITKYSRKPTPETKSFKPDDAVGQKLQSWKQKHGHKSIQLTDVSTSSDNYALWKCWKHPETHLYLAQVGQRTKQNNPTRCPHCSKLWHTHNDLFKNEFVAITKYSKSTPEIKNFKPEDAARQKLQSWKQKFSHKSMQRTDVATSSNNYALWKCPKHPETHLYLAQVYNRTKQKKPTGCPHCSNLWHTHNDLFQNEFVAITQYSKLTPEIKKFKPEDAAGQKLQSWKQKHSHKSIQPSDVGTGSGYYALWKCPKYPENHLYLAKVQNRTRQDNPTRCPHCSNLWHTHKDLFQNEFVGITKYSKSTPEIRKFKPEDAAEQKLQFWKQKHSHKSMQPTDVTTSSGHYALWKCPKYPENHLYLAQVRHRTRQKKPTGCPHCSKLWHTHKDSHESMTHISYDGNYGGKTIKEYNELSECLFVDSDAETEEEEIEILTASKIAELSTDMATIL